MDFNTAKARVKNKHWIRLLESGCSPCELFTETGYTRLAVALSAWTNETILLIEDLRRLGLNIRYFLNDFRKDSEPFAAYGIETIDIGNLPVGSVDFVIAISDEAFRSYAALLNDIDPSIEAVSLDDLLALTVDRHYRFSLYAFRLSVTGRRICILGWADIRHFEDDSLTSGIYDKPLSREDCQANPPHFSELYDDVPEYSEEYIGQIFAEIPIIRDGRALRHVEHRSEFLNVVNGKRLTTDQPLNYDNTIHVFGACLGFGYGTDDKRTFASYLQRHINEMNARRSWRAVNHGVWGGSLSVRESGRRIQAMIESGDIKHGDVVVEIAFLNYHPHTGIRQDKITSYVKEYLKKDFGVDFFYLHDILNEAHRKEKIYIDPTHVNHKGYKVIAHYLNDNFLKNIIESVPSVESVSSELPWQWQALLKKDRSPVEFFTECGSSMLLYTLGCSNHMMNAFERELWSREITPQYIVSGDQIREHTDFILDLSDGMDDNTAHDLRERSGAEIIPLRDVLDIMYDRVFLFEPLAAAKNGEYHVCILGWARAKDLGVDPKKKGLQTTEQIQYDPFRLLRFYEGVTEFSPAYVTELFTPGKIQKNTRPLAMEDYGGKFLTVQAGNRVTRNQPTGWDNTIHFFGGSAAYGVGADDRFTIESRLQEHVNQYTERSSGTKVFRVVNHGLWDGREDTDILNQSLIPSLEDGHVSSGDVVLYVTRTNFHVAAGKKQERTAACVESYIRDLGLAYLDLIPALRVAEKGAGAFVCDDYVGPQCYKAVAIKIYMDYVKGILDGTLPPPTRRQNLPLHVSQQETTENTADEDLTGEQNAEFKEYLSYLENERRDGLASNARIGAIVMNCNPFTKGHRYLAERASAEVDFLYVFVVEEDKSFFPFADRFRLVSEGLSDLKNVRVLRSGKFIISTITFPGYFTKDSAKEVAVDTSLDLRLFCKFIVPALGIGTRFAGNEPTDMVTRQYNHAMKETLPQYGVKFAEFERTTNKDTVISASTVRARLEERNWDAVRDLVPDVTYRYLRDHFGAREGK